MNFLIQNRENLGESELLLTEGVKLEKHLSLLYTTSAMQRTIL